MSDGQGSALAVVIHDSRTTGGQGAQGNQQLLAAFDDKVRERRKRMTDLCGQSAAAGQVKPADFKQEFDQLKSFRDTEHYEGDDVDRTLHALDDLLATAERNVDWSILKAEQDKIAIATFNYRLEAARGGVKDLCHMPEAEGVISPDDFAGQFATLEGMAKQGEYDGGKVDDAFAELARMQSDAEQKVVKAKETAAKRLAEQLQLTKRTSEMRRRMKGICEIAEAKGLVAESDFDTHLDKLLAFSDNGPLTGPEVDKAFEAFRTALDDAEEKVSGAVRKAEELKQAKADFASKQTLLGQRVRVLVSGGFAEESVFETAMKQLETLFASGEVTGDGAAKALQDAENLIAGEEKKAAEQQKIVDLYAATLKIFDQKLDDLGKDDGVGDGDLGGAKKSRDEAEQAVKKRDFPGAMKWLDKGSDQMERLEKKLSERKDILANLEGGIEGLASGVLGEYGMSAQEIIDCLTEEQQVELCQLERRRQSGTKTQRPKVGQQIRALFEQYKDENEPEEEPEPEPEPEETDEQRYKRIHELKLKNKSIASLVALDAEGEIYRITQVFSDTKGKNWRVPGTNGFIKDYCSGFNVMLRNGPNDKGVDTRYNNMIIHFHCSDKQHTKVECAHFKKSHSGGDHDHYGMTRPMELVALGIVNKYV